MDEATETGQAESDSDMVLNKAYFDAYGKIGEALRGRRPEEFTTRMQGGYHAPEGGMPTSVKVGYKTYRIESWSHREGAASSRYGETSNVANRISVDASYGKVTAGETLLHEILHACCAVFNRPDDANEESTVTTLASALATVWIDNPNVMTWIKDALLSGDH